MSTKLNQTQIDKLIESEKLKNENPELHAKVMQKYGIIKDKKVVKK
jgi:hypothetical protein